MAWIDSLFQRETLPVLETSLSYAHKKQLTIMNNIANVETPHYKRQGMPDEQFMDSLKRAIHDRRHNHPAEFRMGDSLDINYDSGVFPKVRVWEGQEFGPERHDENSVVIEKEMADLAKNTMMIQGMQQLLRKKLTMMGDALRDRVV